MDALLIGKSGQKAYNQIDVDCAVCGCKVKKNKRET